MAQIRQHITFDKAFAELSCYAPADGVAEFHVMIHAACPGRPFEEQLAGVVQACDALKEGALRGATVVFRRFFLSDAANQAAVLQAHCPEAAGSGCSVVEQPPLDGTKIALWLHALGGISAHATADGFVEADRGPCRHLWGGGATAQGTAGSEGQTHRLLTRYAAQLRQRGGSLADSCVRTWFFVQNVDVNYAGVVQARNDVFAAEGLTKDTHFIASTGIGGRRADASCLVQLDTYAVLGLVPGQVRHLYAPTHLNPTYEYGVSFERGTVVDYADRRQVFISGTASIDNRGEIVHPGDIRRQTERMWENVEALLAEADATFADVGQMIVYLRDVADYAAVRDLFALRFPDVPTVLLLAPVCRPGWLIEMECVATTAIHRPELPAF